MAISDKALGILMNSVVGALGISHDDIERAIQNGQTFIGRFEALERAVFRTADDVRAIREHLGIPANSGSIADAVIVNARNESDGINSA